DAPAMGRPAQGPSVALWRWPGVDDRAEQLRGLLRVIQRRVCVLAAPLETRGLHRARKHGLAVCHTRQRDRVEHAEGVERIALVARSRHRGVEEVQVEV